MKTTKEVPRELVGVVDRETFDKARSYAIDKANFGLVESIYSQLFSTVGGVVVVVVTDICSMVWC